MVDEGDLGSGSEIGSVVIGAGMSGAESIYTSSRSSPTLSALMIHKIDPTMKIWLGYGKDEETAEKVILFNKKIARKPLPGAPTVDRISSTVL